MLPLCIVVVFHKLTQTFNSFVFQFSIFAVVVHFDNERHHQRQENAKRHEKHESIGIPPAPQTLPFQIQVSFYQGFNQYFLAFLVQKCIVLKWRIIIEFMKTYFSGFESLLVWKCAAFIWYWIIFTSFWFKTFFCFDSVKVKLNYKVFWFQIFIFITINLYAVSQYTNALTARA